MKDCKVKIIHILILYYILVLSFSADLSICKLLIGFDKLLIISKLYDENILGYCWMLIYCKALLKDVFMDYLVNVDEIDEIIWSNVLFTVCRWLQVFLVVTVVWSSCLFIQCVSADLIFSWISHQGSVIFYLTSQLVVLINFVSDKSSLYLKAIMIKEIHKNGWIF